MTKSLRLHKANISEIVEENDFEAKRVEHLTLNFIQNTILLYGLHVSVFVENPRNLPYLL